MRARKKVTNRLQPETFPGKLLKLKVAGREVLLSLGLIILFCLCYNVKLSESLTIKANSAVRAPKNLQNTGIFPEVGSAQGDRNAIKPLEHTGTLQVPAAKAAQANDTRTRAKASASNSRQQRQIRDRARFLIGSLSRQNCFSKVLCNVGASPISRENDVLDDYVNLMNELLTDDEKTGSVNDKKTGQPTVNSKNTGSLSRKKKPEPVSTRDESEEDDKIEPPDFPEADDEDLDEDDDAAFEKYFQEEMRKERRKSRPPVYHGRPAPPYYAPSGGPPTSRYRRSLTKVTNSNRQRSRYFSGDSQQNLDRFIVKRRLELERETDFRKRLSLAADTGRTLGFSNRRQCWRLFHDCPLDNKQLDSLVKGLRQIINSGGNFSALVGPSATAASATGQATTTATSTSSGSGSKVEVILNLGSNGMPYVPQGIPGMVGGSMYPPYVSIPQIQSPGIVPGTPQVSHYPYPSYLISTTTTTTAKPDTDEKLMDFLYGVLNFNDTDATAMEEQENLDWLLPQEKGPSSLANVTEDDFIERPLKVRNTKKKPGKTRLRIPDPFGLGLATLFTGDEDADPPEEEELVALKDYLGTLKETLTGLYKMKNSSLVKAASELLSDIETTGDASKETGDKIFDTEAETKTQKPAKTAEQIQSSEEEEEDDASEEKDQSSEEENDEPKGKRTPQGSEEEDEARENDEPVDKPKKIKKKATKTTTGAQDMDEGRGTKKSTAKTKTKATLLVATNEGYHDSEAEQENQKKNGTRNTTTKTAEKYASFEEENDDASEEESGEGEEAEDDEQEVEKQAVQEFTQGIAPLLRLSTPKPTRKTFKFSPLKYLRKKITGQGRADIMDELSSGEEDQLVELAHKLLPTVAAPLPIRPKRPAPRKEIERVIVPGPLAQEFEDVASFAENTKIVNITQFDENSPNYPRIQKKRSKRPIYKNSVSNTSRVDISAKPQLGRSTTNESGENKEAVSFEGKNSEEEADSHESLSGPRIPKSSDEAPEKSKTLIAVPYFRENINGEWAGGPKGDQSNGPGTGSLLNNVFDLMHNKYPKVDDEPPRRLFRATLNLHTTSTVDDEAVIERDFEQQDVEQPQDDKGKKKGGKKKKKEDDKKKDEKKKDKKEKKKKKKKKKRKRKKGGWMAPWRGPGSGIEPVLQEIQRFVTGFTGTMLYLPPEQRQKQPILLADDPANFDSRPYHQPPPPPAPPAIPVPQYFSVPIYFGDDDSSSEEDCGGKGKKGKKKKKKKKGRREARKKKKKKKKKGGKDSCESGWSEEDGKGKKKGKGKDKDKADDFTQDDLDKLAGLLAGRRPLTADPAAIPSTPVQATTRRPSLFQTTTTEAGRSAPKPTRYTVTRRPMYPIFKQKTVPTRVVVTTTTVRPTTSRLRLTTKKAYVTRPTRRKLQYKGPAGNSQGSGKGTHSVAKGPMIGTVYTSVLGLTTKKPGTKVDDEQQDTSDGIEKMYEQSAGVLGEATKMSEGDSLEEEEDYRDSREARGRRPLLDTDRRRPYRHSLRSQKGFGSNKRAKQSSTVLLPGGITLERNSVATALAVLSNGTGTGRAKKGSSSRFRPTTTAKPKTTTTARSYRPPDSIGWGTLKNFSIRNLLSRYGNSLLDRTMAAYNNGR